MRWRGIGREGGREGGGGGGREREGEGGREEEEGEEREEGKGKEREGVYTPVSQPTPDEGFVLAESGGGPLWKTPSLAALWLYALLHSLHGQTPSPTHREELHHNTAN